MTPKLKKHEYSKFLISGTISIDEIQKMLLKQ